jgi:hypothetical protein
MYSLSADMRFTSVAKRRTKGAHLKPSNLRSFGLGVDKTCLQDLLWFESSWRC